MSTNCCSLKGNKIPNQIIVWTNGSLRSSCSTTKRPHCTMTSCRRSAVRSEGNEIPNQLIVWTQGSLRSSVLNTKEAALHDDLMPMVSVSSLTARSQIRSLFGPRDRCARRAAMSTSCCLAQRQQDASNDKTWKTSRGNNTNFRKAPERLGNFIHSSSVCTAKHVGPRNNNMFISSHRTSCGLNTRTNIVLNAGVEMKIRERCGRPHHVSAHSPSLTRTTKLFSVFFVLTQTMVTEV